MKIKGQITILFSDNGLKIEVRDEEAAICFLKVELSPEQTVQALGRLSHTDCLSTEVRGLDLVGKMMEYKALIFEIPKNMKWKTPKERMSIVLPILHRAIPEGWIADEYFGSQDSFFSKDDRDFARTTIRRWVEIES